MSDVTSRDALLHYQRRLVELLRSDASTAEIRGALVADPALLELHTYTADLDDAALAVARTLLAAWSDDASATRR